MARSAYRSRIYLAVTELLYSKTHADLLKSRSPTLLVQHRVSISVPQDHDARRSIGGEHGQEDNQGGLSKLPGRCCDILSAVVIRGGGTRTVARGFESRSERGLLHFTRIEFQDPGYLYQCTRCQSRTRGHSSNWLTAERLEGALTRCLTNSPSEPVCI